MISQEDYEALRTTECMYCTMTKEQFKEFTNKGWIEFPCKLTDLGRSEMIKYQNQRGEYVD